MSEPFFITGVVLSALSVPISLRAIKSQTGKAVILCCVFPLYFSLVFFGTSWIRSAGEKACTSMTARESDKIRRVLDRIETDHNAKLKMAIRDLNNLYFNSHTTHGGSLVETVYNMEEPGEAEVFPSGRQEKVDSEERYQEPSTKREADGEARVEAPRSRSARDRDRVGLPPERLGGNSARIVS